MATEDRYEASFTIEVQKSPLREGWYARILIGDQVLEDPGSQLTGSGKSAIEASQHAIASLAAGGTYQQLVLEAALLRGTRQAAAKKKKELKG